jgi:mannose-6-phosphate isomerase-like protein (cupin superfamily)
MDNDNDVVSVREIDGFGRNVKGGLKVFRYVAPTAMKRERALVPLARSDTLLSMVQIFRPGGGEQEMHTHTAMDGFWFVLRGRARFYGEGDVLVADLGEHEGIFVPRNMKYWFEAGDCEQLELLQVEAIDHRIKNEMIRFVDKKPGIVEVYSPEGSLVAPNVQLGG